MSIIRRFLTFTAIRNRSIQKPANIINEVSPNLYENLKDSSKQFIKGLLNKDSQFIKQITARSLGERLTQDIQQYKNKDLVQEFNLQKYNFDSAFAFRICPYVIFGEQFRSRIQSEKLWTDIIPFTSNRFFKHILNLGLIEKCKLYQKKQIFGFNCFYEPLLMDVSESERKALRKALVITFETDSHNIDPFIVDCQGSLFQDWKATKFKMSDQ